MRINSKFRLRVLDLKQGQGWCITYDPKPQLLYWDGTWVVSQKIYLDLETPAAYSSCELGVLFLGTPKVHAGIPHMNFGGPPKPWKTLKINHFGLRPHYFEVFWEKGDPQSSCGESPHELCGSPQRGLQIHMEGRQVHMTMGTKWIMAGHILLWVDIWTSRVGLVLHIPKGLILEPWNSVYSKTVMICWTGLEPKFWPLFCWTGVIKLPILGGSKTMQMCGNLVHDDARDPFVWVSYQWKAMHSTTLPFL